MATSVTGCTPGTAANRTRPAAAAPASVATSAISFAESGPLSSQTIAATRRDAVTSQMDTRESPTAARPSAAANVTAAPARASRRCLDKDGLASECDRPIRDGHGKRAVVRDDERGAFGRAQQRGKLALPLGIDATGRFV